MNYDFSIRIVQANIVLCKPKPVTYASLFLYYYYSLITSHMYVINFRVPPTSPYPQLKLFQRTWCLVLERKSDRHLKMTH